VRPPSREILMCGVAASEGATQRHAAAALWAASGAYEYPARRGENLSASRGVSAAGSVELIRWPVTLATVVRLSQFGSDPGANQERILNERC
jgi:hypothetical protein